MKNIGNKNKKGTDIMGMSASQARFLSLTARKTNVEYEGQQINQQRTALSNESSNYYSQLTSMSVPIPPSSTDYSKVTYTFKDGTETNTITSLVAKKTTKDDGIYMLNYVQQIPADTMVVNGTAVVSKTLDESNAVIYSIGKNNLQTAIDLTYKDETTGESTFRAIEIYDDSDSSATKPTDTATKQYFGRNELKQRFTAAGIPAEVANTYSDSELINKLTVENQYRAMAAEKYPTSDKDNMGWHVMYRKNSSTGSYDAVLFSDHELARADYNEKTTLSLSGIKQYVFGESTESREIKNAEAKVDQDATGRYISLYIYDDETHTSGTKYDLTTTTESDDDAYNDAMNQYYYDKEQYDKQVQEVNAKIEIIQTQDKNLELKLKQLDTEQNAISTEMDAVKKVISKNVESSFKTFNA